MILRQFIAIKDPQAARRYSQALLKSLKYLIDQPEMGCLLDNDANIRELVSGDYLARYRIVDDRVIVFKIRHSKEEG